MTTQNRKTKIEFIKELVKDPDRKSLFRMVFEFCCLFLTYRELPKHYFSKYLFKKGITNIKDYLPNRLLDDKIPLMVNDKSVKEVLDNKLYFDMYYRQFNITLPRIVMFNHRQMFVLNNKSIEVKNVHDFTFLLEEVFKQNPGYSSIFVKKTLSSSSGNKIYKLYYNQLKTDPEILNELYSELLKSEFIFQETVIQHPDLNRLNPSCLNTVRIDTFIDTTGEINVISGLIRMSTNNLHIDNVNAGGCFVGISPITGKLKKLAYPSIKNGGVKVLVEHPITKTVFEDFFIPYFPQVQELVIKAARFMPGLRLIGWDVGIGESGPVLIEGNSNYEVSGSDLAYGGYLTNPVFRKILYEVNYL
jgi:Sugar-transfer associated ATP-grasp